MHNNATALTRYFLIIDKQNIFFVNFNNYKNNFKKQHLHLYTLNYRYIDIISTIVNVIVTE